MKIVPIAMRCTQEQFEELKPFLENQLHLRVFLRTRFIDRNRFLVNNYLGKLGNISDVSKEMANEDGRRVFTCFDPEIFLSHCGLTTDSVPEQKLIPWEESTLPVSKVRENDNEFYLITKYEARILSAALASAKLDSDFYPEDGMVFRTLTQLQENLKIFSNHPTRTTFDESLKRYVEVKTTDYKSPNHL